MVAAYNAWEDAKLQVQTNILSSTCNASCLRVFRWGTALQPVLKPGRLP